MEKMLGVMLDCSRNAVMKPEKVKKYAQIIRKMGYNTLMLYTEDTYEIESQPYFGYLRGRYTKQELKEIDSYCQSIGIEFIPCIQTLAHLNQMFEWQEIYSDIQDCDDILLIGSEKTYALIDEMIRTLSECFTSKKIHIGMDEAYRVGSGKYEVINGSRDRFEIINEHLHKVCEIAEKYDMEPMIWSDMFVKLAAGTQGTETQYGDADITKILERASLPENISLVYWDYYHNEYEHYDKMLKRNKLFERKVYFGGGAWTWRGFAPFNKLSIERTAPAIDACIDNDAQGIFFTVWGDDGAECSPFTILPTLMYAAEKLNGNTDMDSIKKKFREIVGVEYDSFMLLDKLDTPCGNHKDNNSASKYLLYNDPFMGIRDALCSDNDNEYYKNLEGMLRNTEKGEFLLIFTSYEKLAKVLSVKSALGIRTRKAYLENDRKELENIIADYEKALIYLAEFYNAFRERWYADNKPQGFEIQDIRLGGLRQRIENCRDRLVAFVSGKLTEITELEEKILPDKSGGALWRKCVTANVISHV